MDSSLRELYSSYQDLEDVEEKSLEDLRETEEQFLTLTLSSLQTVLKDEVKLYKKQESLNLILGLMEQVLSEDTQEKEEDIEEEKVEIEEDLEDAKPPDVIDGASSVQETGTSLGSRTGSVLSLSSMTSFSCREEVSHQQLFSTIKRCHSPFTSVPASDQPRRRETRRRLDVTRPPLPPLPPQPPRPRTEENSLKLLTQKLEEISLKRPPLVPRSPYLEETCRRRAVHYRFSSTPPLATEAVEKRYQELHEGGVKLHSFSTLSKK